eukprot:CAMPEP_0181323434 /NCGR_PEP_ID=MMETSP1101-20121128/19784_1 /TAXON_ID=46948 /ORGANISM="Rhodomonas abbreviata, Strain Caron Lab Isolate" /LENGTH=322 /DNA_ID=CAMNT_0023431463 /DNA_START=28 /DNA_END=996 /DNA_ORIENTATION=+
MTEVETRKRGPEQAFDDPIFGEDDCDDILDILNSPEFEGFNPELMCAEFDLPQGGISPPGDDTENRESTFVDSLSPTSPGTCSSSEIGAEDTSSGSTIHKDGCSPVSSDTHEDKKRRNRIAAKMCRQKKKRMMQSVEERQNFLEQERLSLKKENETLRSTNRALENQLAFFHGLFKANTDAAFKLSSSAGKIVFGKTSGALSDVAKASVPQGTGLALGVVFFAIFSFGKLEDFVTPKLEKSEQPEFLVEDSGRRPGRMLLQFDDVEEQVADDNSWTTSFVEHPSFYVVAALTAALFVGLLFWMTAGWRALASKARGKVVRGK